ncbi:hypothetical protein BDZ91DRAFT_700669 [Kalaharituber pfeilii]|nr:hypothetical protein BDZ91DRAFT_700669 [Kalaharituber pfeilii]
MRFSLLPPVIVALTVNTVSATRIEELTESEISSFSSIKATSFGSALRSFCGCTLLSVFAIGKVHFRGSAKYETESTTKFWSKTSWNTPACVFVPTSAKDVAKGITIATLCGSEFAIRGGGHMPVPNFTNTNGGILFALSGLNTLSLSSTKQSLFVGPSYNWGQVYNFLTPHGLYVIGGRLAPVGVPGLILGGGINFFSNKYGFAMDNLLSAEVVLASGKIVIATPTNEYSDLLWALKGGSSNFGIVTKFELRTYPVATTWAAMGTFIGEENFATFYSALVNFTNSGYTEKGAGIIPQINFQSATASQAAMNIGVQVLVHEGNITDPAIFNEFKKVQTLQTDFMISPPAQVSQFLGDFSIPGARRVFRVQSSLATIEAAKHVHRTFYGLTPKLASTVTSLASAGIAFQPIPASTIAARKATGGNTFGIKSGENFFWYIMSVNWDDEKDDKAVNAWIEEVGLKMKAGFKSLGITGNDGREFLYMNDGQGSQDIYGGYGSAEITTMKSIREKYDKHGKVFGKQGLCKGGFKF